MSESRAADSRASVRRGTRWAFAVPFWLAFALALLPLATAQPAPTVTLGSYAYIVGETLELAATNLEPGGSYRVELTPPAQGDERPAPLVSVVEASADGMLIFTAPLRQGGVYAVRLEGPRLDATLNVRVSGADEAVGQADPPADSEPGSPVEGGDESADEGAAGAEPDAQSDAEAETETETDAEEGAMADDEAMDEAVGEAEETPGEADGDDAPNGAAVDEEDATAQDEGTADGDADTEGDQAGQDDGAPASEDPDASDDEAVGSTQGGATGGTPDGEDGGEAQDGTTGGTAPGVTRPGVTPPGDAGPDGPPEGAGAPGAPAGSLNVSIVSEAVVAEDARGEEVWRLDFPSGSGLTAGPARSDQRLVVGRGNHLLELDPATGRVLARHRLPAQVTDIAFSGSVIEATVAYANGVERRVRVLSNGPQRLEPFDPHLELYGWLREEARVADPLARLADDPTNPWLYLAVAERAPEGAEGRSVDEYLERALETSATFYERAQLADAFLSLRAPRQDLATRAMDAALQDFVARGYRSELLTDEQLADAYGFPLGRLLEALGRGNLERAGFWADWLYRTSSSQVPETQAALREYANYLREAGQEDAASLWRTRANEGGGFQASAVVAQAALTVGRTGWYGVAALLVSILALHVTLLAKYWRPQTLNMQRMRAAGKQVSPVAARLTFMRFATFMEKLVVVLLFVAALALAALQGWATNVDDVPPSWGSGSLATPPAIDAVVALGDGREDTLFVQGYAAQTAGDEMAARNAYARLENDADALNNLAVLTGDDSHFERALELDAAHEEALYNLGRAPNPSRLLTVYAPEAPVLAAPGQDRLAGALAGTYLEAWADAFTNPWATLTQIEGVSLPAWVWTLLVVLFLAWAIASIVCLFVPRPRLARNAPRTFLYHLLALLLPGTGLADEFWGVFLMVPWAIFGVDFILNYLPGGPDATMALRTDSIALIVIYVLNTVAFFVELTSYRRRMAALKHDDPQTARDYGMRVPAPEYG